MVMWGLSPQISLLLHVRSDLVFLLRPFSLPVIFA